MSATACAPAQRDFGIALDVQGARADPGGVLVSARQEVRLSSEAREALRHGVPLRVRVDMTVRQQGQWSALDDDTIFYELRYLPLSDRYQLSGPLEGDVPRTYPRLRHAIAELADIDWRLDGVGEKPGRYNLKIRSQLDRDSMPAPMRLPMLFSPQWAHDSGWVSQEFDIEG